MKKISDSEWEDLFGVRKNKDDEKEYEEFIKAMEGCTSPVNKDEIELKVSFLKIPKKGYVKVDDKIDLHGLTKQEVAEKLCYFLKNSFESGLRRVLVITGKGKHSESGAKIRPFVEKLFKGKCINFVKNYGVAPKSQGGEGAFVVFLRK